MRVGVLTGGGDCPGLNAVIRAVVRKGERQYGDRLVGFRDGWKGVIDSVTMPLDVERCRGILPRGGTILGTSRTNPYKVDEGVSRVLKTLDAEAVDALVAIGGEDTLESHDRVMVVEVMGRHAGWIATYAGIAGGAAEILVPEEEFDIDVVSDMIRRRHAQGRFASIVVVAEGAKPKAGSMAVQSGEVDQFGHVRLGGIGNQVAEEIEKRTGFETRVTILGHVQRGGTPTAFDRILATRFGVAAIDAVHDGAFGQMVALQAGDIVRVPLADAVGELKTVDPALLHGVADTFFG